MIRIPKLGRRVRSPEASEPVLCSGETGRVDILICAERWQIVVVTMSSESEMSGAEVDTYLLDDPNAIVIGDG